MNRISRLSSSRQKAVWGPKRTASVLLVFLACMAPNFAAAKTHSHEAARKTAGVPGSVARPYKLDAELSRRATDRHGATLTRVIVTLVPGATLPPAFTRYEIG